MAGEAEAAHAERVAAIVEEASASRWSDARRTAEPPRLSADGGAGGGNDESKGGWAFSLGVARGGGASRRRRRAGRPQG